jgi:hypothetical protein
MIDLIDPTTLVLLLALAGSGIMAIIYWKE